MIKNILKAVSHVKTLMAIGRALLFSSAIILPLMAPLFLILIYGQTEEPKTQDFQVEVTRDALEEDFSRLAPRKLYQIGIHIDDLAHIEVDEQLFESRFVYWAKNVFDRSVNDRSEISEDTFRVVNANELQTSQKAVRHIRDSQKFVAYVSHESSGTLKNDFYLSKYPFDTHTLRFIFEPKDLTAEEILLGIDPHSTLTANTSLGSWNVKAFRAYSEVHVAKSDFSDPSTIGKGSLWTSVPRVVFEVVVERQILSHLLKEILPLLLLMVMVYLIFYVRVTDFETRIEMSSLAFLTVTALHWAASDELANVSYLTAMDQFFLVSYGLVLLLLIEAIVLQTIIPEDESKLKQALTHGWFRFGIPALRIIYPLFLAASWYWIALSAIS